MLINRAPLHNKDSIIDYSACVYPTSLTDQQAYFFNHEGYMDDEEELFQEQQGDKKRSFVS